MAQGITGASAEAEKEIYEQIIGVDISEMLNELPAKWKQVVAQCLVRDGAKRIKSAAAVKELILNGSTSTQEPQSFIDDETIISDGEPEELLDDETIIDDGRATQQKAPKKEPVKKAAPKKKEPKLRKESEPKLAYDEEAKGKKKKKTLIGVGVVIVVMVISGFAYAFMSGGTDSNWEMAQSINSIESYESYISLNPESEFVTEAKENLVWLKVTSENTVEAFEGYLNEFPAGKFALKANDTIAWLNANSINTVEAYQTYLVAFPEGLFKENANSNISSLNDQATNLAKKEEQAAKDKLDLGAWNKAKKTNTLSSYNAYLNSFTHGKFRSDATKSIANLNNVDKLIADEIASFGSDNDWVNKVNKNRNSSSFIKNEIEKAKKYKSAQGKARLAYFYLEGFGMKRDYKKAENLALEGSKKSIPLASYIYGRTEYGWDSGEAAYFKLLKTADGKIDLVDNALGYMYLSEYTDEGTPYNPKLGLYYLNKFYTKYYSINNEKASEAASSIAGVYRRGRGTEIEKNKEQQLEWMKKAYNIVASGTNAFRIADFYLINSKNPKFKVSSSEIGRWYKISADLGYSAGMDMIANCYINGSLGFVKNRNEGIKWYKKSADKGGKRPLKKLKELGVNYTPKK